MFVDAFYKRSDRGFDSPSLFSVLYIVQLLSLLLIISSLYSACDTYIQCVQYYDESLFLRWVPYEALNFTVNFVGIFFALLMRNIVSYVYENGKPRFEFKKAIND